VLVWAHNEMDPVRHWDTIDNNIS